MEVELAILSVLQAEDSLQPTPANARGSMVLWLSDCPLSFDDDRFIKSAGAIYSKRLRVERCATCSTRYRWKALSALGLEYLD